jgi:hypothetical protein
MKQLVASVFELVHLLIWSFYISGPLIGWIYGAMLTGVSGAGVSLGANNDAAGPAFGATFTISLILGFLWMLWSILALYVSPEAKTEKKAKDVNEIDEAPGAGLHALLDASLVFIQAFIWARFVSVHLSLWWVTVAFARPVGNFQVDQNIGIYFAATLIVSVILYVVRAIIPTARDGVANSAGGGGGGDTTRASSYSSRAIVERCSATVRSTFPVFVSLILTFWTTNNAVIGLSRVMTNEAALPASPNPTVCPTPTDAYNPANYPGETFALCVVCVAFVVVLSYAFDNVTRTRTGPAVRPFAAPLLGKGPGDELKYAATWANARAQNGAELNRVSPRIPLSHVEGAHPITFAVGYALGSLFSTEGTLLLLASAHAFCYPYQVFASRLAGTVVVAAILGLCWTICVYAVYAVSGTGNQLALDLLEFLLAEDDIFAYTYAALRVPGVRFSKHSPTEYGIPKIVKNPRTENRETPFAALGGAVRSMDQEVRAMMQR